MEIDEVLRDLKRREYDACRNLFAVVYKQLLKLAQIQLNRESCCSDFTNVELVHELFEKMMRQKKLNVNNPGHFYALAVCGMKQILVDSARRRSSIKNGGSWNRIDIDPHQLHSQFYIWQPDGIKQLMRDLKSYDEACFEIVRLRFFLGLSIVETAEALDISTSTVNRYWKKARLWMRRNYYEYI